MSKISKKISTIFLSLFLVGILSVSCSNKDKTAPDTSTPKTINAQYAGIWEYSTGDNVEIDINGNIHEYKNSSRGPQGEIIEANDPNYKVKIYGKEIKITFNNVNKATVNIDGQDVTYTKTSKGIEQYNNNSYVSTSAVIQSQYFWVSIKDSKVGMSAGNDQTSEPQYQGYFPVTGYGIDYSFSTDFYGEPNAIKGTLKFASDGNSVTVRFTENPGAPAEMLNKDIVCNIKK
ncbi:hypothetical protein BRSU_2086 [Brachyspira suanatina]|uniref:Lipocalin-like domain-containing protein n=1 Tax=Brachyspira suanatina TaxID=381802 RepID=A0A0G4K9P2_9SPIR|nr:hypothetical protein [Brachyspira suanatina]CRF34541.1 hypothetical protein BRSU_2086 [Brachyspira suanatina]